MLRTAPDFITVDASADEPTPSRATRGRMWLLNAFALVFAYFYAITLASFPLDAFNDRNNYLTYAKYSDVIFIRYQMEGIFSILANEPLWLLLNSFLSRFLSFDDVVRTLIFVPAFLVAWQMLRRDPRHAIWMIVFLLTPQVVKNHVVHLRQGVAIAVFMTGYFAKPAWLRYGLMVAAAFIHSSFLFLLMIGAMVWASTKIQMTPRLRLFALTLAFVAISGAMVLIAGSFGARQAIAYAFSELDISGLGFLFWSAIFALLVTAGRAFLQDNMFALANLSFYLVSYFTVPVSARIFESALFLVFLAGLNLPNPRRLIFLVAFTIFSGAQYLTRLDLPWLGWGRIW